MEKDFIWTCTFCKKNFESRSKGNCPFCKRKLTSFDLSKMPLERKPDQFPPIQKIEGKKDTEARIDYTSFYKSKKQKENGEK